jgi:ABC-type transport system involved in multi-copper enzyme maturation permease subunit
MTAVLSLAHHTLLDALRERIFRTLAAFLVVLFGVSQLVKPLALGEGWRVTLDLGLALISLSGLLLVLFLATHAIQRECERRTILVLLSRPVRRGEFLLGKYLGMLAVVGLAVMGMLAILTLVLAVSGETVRPALALAGGFAYLELVILCALGLLLTTLAGPALAGFALCALFVAGHLAPSLLAMVNLSPGPLSLGVRALAHIIPRLDLYELGPEVVHGSALAVGDVLWAVAYAILYATACLLLALLIFRRREFA